MGLVKSPDMFCTASGTVADMANEYMLDTTSAFVVYPPTDCVYYTAAATSVSPFRLQCLEVYMDDLMAATQGDKAQQKRVTERTLLSLKKKIPSLPAERKDSVSLKKDLQGETDWTTLKEILGWLVNTEKDTLTLSP